MNAINLQAELDGVCHRCGSSRMTLTIRDRKATIPTCRCKEETLTNMLNAILVVLDRELNEPRYEQAREELREFITEFDD